MYSNHLMRSQEHNDLGLFVEILGGIDESQCEFSDRPDLLFKSDSRVIGIEHTRLYREDKAIPSGRQLLPQERLHWEIVDQACQRFRGRQQTPLQLYVEFKEPFNSRKSDIASIGNALTCVVEWSLHEHRPQGGEVVWVWQWEAERRGIPWPDAIQQFNYCITSPEFEVWGPSYGYAVPSVDFDVIDSRVRDKEARLNDYRQRCDEIWLLIVTDTGTPAAHFEVSDSVLSATYKTAFHRVYLLTIFHRSLTRLNVEPCAISQSA
jgi:hypothetical protein